MKVCGTLYGARANPAVCESVNCFGAINCCSVLRFCVKQKPRTSSKWITFESDFDYQLDNSFYYSMAHAKCNANFSVTIKTRNGSRYLQK